MTRILSIDPGMTTGIAFYQNGVLEMSMTVTYVKVLSNGFLNNLVKMTQPEVVLIEDIPRFTTNELMDKLHPELVRWFSVAGFTVYEIQPSQWKGLTARVEIPGQHARDAATMCRWWIEKEYNRL